ncbi:hypothetical protein [Caulobacter sp. UC70_42]|uniref:hypothetical protein n=1 Tax=Caulobacter sp. UC70_42 TaxID=3374551 RepID=UPI0037578501
MALTETKKEKEATDLLLDSITTWIDKIFTPEFHEFKRKQLVSTLAFDEPWHDPTEVEEFVLDAETERQHELVIAWFNLSQTLTALSQSQFYLRRFPFGGLPVTRVEHARNVLEMYFGSVYMMKERLKRFLTLHKKMYPNTGMNVGHIIKQFEKTFDSELRARNSIHHHQPFDDIALHRLTISGLLATHNHEMSARWKNGHEIYYRRFCKEWIERIDRRSKIVAAFLNIISEVVIVEATFLKIDTAIQ